MDNEIGSLHAKFRFLEQDYSELRQRASGLEHQLQRLFREHLEMTKRHAEAQAARDVAQKHAAASEDSLRQEIVENTKLKTDLIVARGECSRLAAELLRAQARLHSEPTVLTLTSAGPQEPEC